MSKLISISPLPWASSPIMQKLMAMDKVRADRAMEEYKKKIKRGFSRLA
jgi:hypothetical protein